MSSNLESNVDVSQSSTQGSIICDNGSLEKASQDHIVNFNISVEHVFNVDSENKLPAEAMKAWQYYHIEYNLIPGKSTSRADVVMSGMVAKMYSDYDTRLLKTRSDGDKIYVMWSHKHPIPVTKNLLLDLFDHTVNVRLWDTKDKVSVRAKFDRPKVFRLPPPPGPKTVDARFDGGGTAQSNARRQLYIEKSTSPSKMKQSASDTKTERSLSSADNTPTELRRRRVEKDHVSERGKCVLSIPLASLFSGKTVLFVKSEPYKHFAALKQVIVKIALNKPLMSNSLSRELCPMKLNIVRCKNNPENPVSYQDLSEQCKPVFARYKFCGQEVIDTEGLPHDKDIQWNHTHVILLGVLSRPKLEEFLTGPPFEVELHDRDRRTDIVKPIPKIFNINGNEEKLFDTSGKSKALNPPGIAWDPYGIAKFDLSPLLLGEQKLRIKSPVLPCVRPQKSSRNAVLKTEVALDQTGSVPCGRYLESGTVLTVELSLSHPLVATTNYLQLSLPVQNNENNDCPFIRVVYFMSTAKSKILSDIMDHILDVNAAVFKLDNLPKSMYSSALSTYKLSKAQETSKELDYITGFHVLDGSSHLLVLEGLAEGTITKMWEKLPKTHGQEFQVLYNSELRFSSRLYSTLQPHILKLKLFEPLENLVKHPSLYVTGSVSRDAYDGLICLCELRCAKLLLNCSRNNTFPTASMIKQVAMEFGVPHSLNEVKNLKPSTTAQSVKLQQTTEQMTCSAASKRKGRWSPIDNYNQDYDQRSSRESVNFIEQNKAKVHHISEENNRKSTKTVKVCCDEEFGHNYSTSTKNATELAKKKIREILAQTPNERYTYSQDYACQTVSPRCVSEVKQADETENKARFRTTEGFLYPAHRTALESNNHGNLPHYSTVEQLQEPWEENILHAAKLKPTVDWKTFSWNERGKDFSMPRKITPQPHQVTIHLPGQRRAKELLEYTSQEEDKWRKKLVVEDTTFKVHRTATSIELKDRLGAAFQQDKARSILKDNPKKLSLSAPKLRLSPIPSVDVVNYPKQDREEQRAFQPGPRNSLSWSRDTNCIAIKRDTNVDNKFKLYFTPHSPLAKLSIKPLQDEERSGHLWETPVN